MYECTKTFEIKPPAYSGCGSMLVHKGTLWYALESGRERTTLTDSRIKLVLSDRLFKTITVDNGTEFADCEGIEKKNKKGKKRTEVYYCHPYCSAERGSNENQNRMIRSHL